MAAAPFWLLGQTSSLKRLVDGAQTLIADLRRRIPERRAA
jgi:hypothetical protein